MNQKSKQNDTDIGRVLALRVHISIRILLPPTFPMMHVLALINCCIYSVLLLNILSCRWGRATAECANDELRLGNSALVYTLKSDCMRAVCHCYEIFQQPSRLTKQDVRRQNQRHRRHRRHQRVSDVTARHRRRHDQL